MLKLSGAGVKTDRKRRKVVCRQHKGGGSRKVTK